MPRSINHSTTPQISPSPAAKAHVDKPSDEALFVGQNRALQLIVSGACLRSIYEALIETVEASLAGQAVAAILILDGNGKQLRHGAAPSLPESYNAALDGIAIGPDIGTCGAAAYRNKVVITVDIENDPSWSKFKKLPLALGLRAAWSMPIRSTKGRVLGTFCTYFRECRLPTPMECEIVDVLAKTAAIAIEQRMTELTLRESEEALRQTLVELESRVERRTAELAETNSRLRIEIAERQKTEVARQYLLQQLASAEEAERRRISRELHDQVGQELAALMLGLRSLRPHLDAAPSETLRQLEGITDTVGKEVHGLALELRPTALDDLGLAHALSHYLEEWSARTGVVVQFRRGPAGRERFPLSVETAIYRLVLEALANVAKHAGARRVAVAVERCADHVLAIVEDDGKGFDADGAARNYASPRLGLRGMRERAANCGGTVNIESSCGQGTTVLARIPLPVPEVLPV